MTNQNTLIHFNESFLKDKFLITQIGGKLKSSNVEENKKTDLIIKSAFHGISLDMSIKHLTTDEFSFPPMSQPIIFVINGTVNASLPNFLINILYEIYPEHPDIPLIQQYDSYTLKKAIYDGTYNYFINTDKYKLTNVFHK